ncbi:MAG: tRNA (N(6)-L-threonylcarbamoyladenosine(37)-C(2))-methylthiotransferase MtaB [Candidatus Brocadiaceae bacterium]|nr:tRNA (N(6)-L-threonylcarbamoyladenosine(37)-C(2))-methylthiotransferase MtaB [Candidatus Brocadiaceae bacterium]
MKTCAFVTLGCKVNQYETQAIRESLAAHGFMETSPEQKADVYVINTCTVTSAGDEKSRQYIKKFKRKSPNATVVVTGCYAEAEAEVIKSIEGVNYVITREDESRLAEIISRTTGQDFSSVTKSPLKIEESKDPFRHAPSQENGQISNTSENPIYDLKISRFAGHTRAFLKIEDGCDVFCSYCIIPHVRGGVKSRGWQDICDEAQRLIQNGYREIVLTGIHLGAYGREKKEGISFVDILERLSVLSGLERIRVSSIEVNEVTPAFIDLVANSKNICPHFHIPLQSGDDFILRRMNRTYTPQRYLEIVDSIRSKIDLPSFTTDVMVGFPGETGKHFQNTVDFCKQVGFGRMHIFPFSVRKGTPAAKMPDHCRPQIIRRRRTILKETADILALAYKEHFVGGVAEVLVETERDQKTNRLCGYSERYIKVLFNGPDEIKNTIVPVRIEAATPACAVGKLI